MSKSSIASAQKIPPPLPTKSAWAKGPPQNSSTAPSPRSQSPAPPSATPPANATHSRRASNLGQGVPIKDGVSVPRSNVGSVKHGSSPVTFGSIDDTSAPISSSPAAAPATKPAEGVKSFGSLPTSGHVNGKSSISSTPAPSSQPSTTSSPSPATPSKMKVDVRKFFQNPGSSSSSAPPSHPPSDTASPSSRPSSLPPHHHQQQSSSSSSSSHQPPPQPSQIGPHSYTPFVPGMRPQQNAGGGGQPPRSPIYSRQMANGAGGPRPPGGPGGPGAGPQPMPAGLSSPRLGTHPHPVQPAGMPPPPQAVPVPGWGYGYYPEHYMAAPYSPGWYPPQPLPYQQQHHPHQHHPPPPGPPGPPHGGMPMSPRNQPPPLQPGTPTLPHTVPPAHAPPAHAASPPPTPASARLNTNANAFVPGRAKITFKNPDGTEVAIEALKKPQPQPAPSSPGPTTTSFGSPGNRRSVIRMESEDAKRKRLAEEEERERAEKAKKDAEEKAKRDAEEKVKRDAEEKVRKEEEERRRKAEEQERERIRKEEEEKERVRLEEEERKERLRREEEEKERLRMEEEEKERLRVAEAEAKELERIRKEDEEAARLREEKERLRLEEEEKAKVASEAEVNTIEEAEEGEVEESNEVPSSHTPTPPPTDSKERAKEILRINTKTPPTDLSRRRPGPLDLSYAKEKGAIAAPLPSALSTARHIDDLGSVIYPDGVKSPKAELNTNAKDGKFRYDRDFLLQFMSVCKEKPDMLPPLDAIGLEPSDQSSFSMSRGGSGRHRQSSGAMPPPSVSRQNSSVGLGIMSSSTSGKSGFPSNFSMGNFATPGSKMSSEERFAMANSGRVASVGGPSGLPFGRQPPPMVRSASQGGPGGAPSSSNRVRSKRGEKRNESNRAPGGQQSHGSAFGQSGSAISMGQGGMSFEPVAPLKASENRWVPASTSRKPQAVDTESPEVVDRKVKGLLNKLTMEKFDSISDQIIAWANKSEKEKDGRTLIQVIRLVFEKATDEATWSEMYARLCRKMMEQISSKVQDDGIKNQEGKPIAGGQLFRKYLLNRCQEDFERGWVAKEATAAAAATKASEDKAAKLANEKNKDGEAGESELYSEEYYAAQKAKRQGLGLIKFIGELFKLQMLTERIMHECVKKLLGNVENPEEEEIESLCKLLTTVGSILDTNKARAHMDVYFSRMKELTKSQNVSSRMQFMLQDIIELRERKWITRNQVAAPATIAQIHEAAAKEKAMADKESYQRQMSMSRGGSRRGNERGGGGGEFSQVGPDGWAVAGGSGPPRPPPKAGDLTNFGKISKTTPMTFGPSSVFAVAGKKDGKPGREALSRTSSSSNMFSMLSQNSEIPAEAVSSSKGGTTEPPAQRRKLQLLPRSKPSADEPALASENSPVDQGAEEPMSAADAKKKIDEDLKEFFGVRNLEEAEVYFTDLPAEHHFRLVDKLVTSAIESKESDAQLVGDFFARAVSKDLCSPAAFEEGFTPTAEILSDIAIDAPKAFNLMAIMLKGAALEQDEERRTRIAEKTMDTDKLLSLLS